MNAYKYNTSRLDLRVHQHQFSFMNNPLIGIIPPMPKLHLPTCNHFPLDKSLDKRLGKQSFFSFNFLFSWRNSPISPSSLGIIFAISLSSSIHFCCVSRIFSRNNMSPHMHHDNLHRHDAHHIALDCIP